MCSHNKELSVFWSMLVCFHLVAFAGIAGRSGGLSPLGFSNKSVLAGNPQQCMCEHLFLHTCCFTEEGWAVGRGQGTLQLPPREAEHPQGGGVFVDSVKGGQGCHSRHRKAQSISAVRRHLFSSIRKAPASRSDGGPVLAMA